MVYRHTQLTMPRIDTFRSNAFRLKKGAIHESIKLNYIENGGEVREEINNFEYDTETRILYLPNYQSNPSDKREILIRYNIKIDNAVKFTDSFSDKSYTGILI